MKYFWYFKVATLEGNKAKAQYNMPSKAYVLFVVQ